MARKVATREKAGPLAVDYRPIATLIPFASNARTHSDEQVAQIAASIREFGFTNPVLVDGENGIIAGHGRVLAARKLSMETVPCIELAGLSETQKRAYIIADNQLALNAGWNVELLSTELKGLDAEGFDLGLLGFDNLDELMGIKSEGAGAGASGGAGSLADRFGIPPFSVLNAREGWWQDRKRAWLSLGIQSELGRGEQLIPNGGGATGARPDMMPGGARSGQSHPMSEPSSSAPAPTHRNAAPGGSLMPAADYSKRKRGNGKGQAIG